MKTNKIKILLILMLGLFAQFNLQAGTVTWTDTSKSFSYNTASTYVNNLNDTIIINVGPNKNLVFTYDTKLNGDYLKIQTIDASGNVINTELQTASTVSGTVTTSVPTGKARITFVTDAYNAYTPTYTGFTLSYTTTQATYSTNQDLYVIGQSVVGGNSIVSGKLGIGTSTPIEKLHVIGSIRGGGIGGALNVKTDYGYMNIGPTSTLYANFSTDRAYYSFDKAIYLANGLLSASGTQNLSLQTNGATKMFIKNNGNVGIGTITPTQALNVVGKIAITPSGTTSNEGYNGNLVITKPSASGQFINLVPDGNTPWSIGTVYNSTTFAIGQGKALDTDFAAPSFVIKPNGCVGIGCVNPQNALDVAGTIRAAEVKVVSVLEFSDFVFEPHYKLPKLADVQNYIQSNGHLPNIPSAAEVKENGMSLVDMQVKLLQKVEELTLYVIEQQNRINDQQKEIKALKQTVKRVK